MLRNVLNTEVMWPLIAVADSAVPASRSTIFESEPRLVSNSMACLRKYFLSPLDSVVVNSANTGGMNAYRFSKSFNFY